MKHFIRPIGYLENKDFDKKGNLVNPIKSKPVLVMIQSSNCGHCTVAKPDFQEFANKHKNKVFCATIQADGNRRGEKELRERLTSIVPDFRGYPTYVKFIKGKLHPERPIGRSVKDYV